MYTEKSVHYQKVREMRERKKKLLDEMKTPCIKCGESRKVAIDYHHIEPSLKSFNLCKEQEHGIKSIQEEIRKCVCLCANCHREFHYFYGESANGKDLINYLTR